ncbi:hypothetical protein CHISP_3436 [Chitinispirillum alkaliphilum]|nr:hypothetical protein CHISP_3436 [Chitinispirillum alkaliphilum]
MSLSDLEDVVEVSEGDIPEMPDTAGIIKQKISELKGKIPKQHMPVTIFVSEFGKDLAHMQADKELWVECGFDWSNYDYFKALHKELFRANSYVVVNRDNVSGAMREWQQEQNSVAAERNRLIAAARIVVQRDPTIRSTLREISEGNSNMDNIQDILSLAKLLLKAKDTVSNINIGGIRMDEAYLNRKREWTGELKQILNRADALRHVRQEEIIYRNKIILLCRQAQAKINVWLDAVYFDHPEKKSKYASEYFKRQRKKTNKTKNRLGRAGRSDNLEEVSA